MSTLIILVIGIFIGSNLPQPRWAKNVQDKVVQNRRFDGNFVAAEKLLLEAAELGSGHAAHELGIVYITGGPGV